MKSMIIDYLSDVLEDCRPDDSGEQASYIPELAHADPDHLAVCLATIDEKIYAVGNTEVEFTIQSISKPFIYALALEDRGFDTVLEQVSVEPPRRRLQRTLPR